MVRADGQITTYEHTGGAGAFASRCDTCDDEFGGASLLSALIFFDDHANQDHAVELYRDWDTEGSRRSTIHVEDTGSGRAAGTD